MIYIVCVMGDFASCNLKSLILCIVKLNFSFLLIKNLLQYSYNFNIHDKY